MKKHRTFATRATLPLFTLSITTENGFSCHFTFDFEKSSQNPQKTDNASSLQQQRRRIAFPAQRHSKNQSSTKCEHQRSAQYPAMVLLHVKKADDLQMLVREQQLNSIPSLFLPQSGPQVEVPASTPLSEAIPHVANLWNTMLKMRKLADCCNDLATYAPPLSQTHLPSSNRRHPMNFQPRAAPVRDVCVVAHTSCLLQLRRGKAAC